MQTSIRRWAARGAAVFCLAFAAFQVALALGAPLGDIAWGGSTPVLAASMRWASAAAAVYLLVAAGLMEARAGDWAGACQGGCRSPSTSSWRCNSR